MIIHEWNDLFSDPKIAEIIRKHADVSPKELALKLSKQPNLPKDYILWQVEGRQKAKTKLPLWFKNPLTRFPPKISMEQCSSEMAAQYKASLVKGKLGIDLTGGFGVDSFFLAKQFESFIYIEKNQTLFEIVNHNFKVLGCKNITCLAQNGLDYLQNQLKANDCSQTVIYLDPARRDENQNKVVGLEAYDPNVIAYLPLLFEKASVILIKTSPMLDIDLAIKSLKNVAEVHIVAVENECKEVLYVLKKDFKSSIIFKTVNFYADFVQQFDFYKQEEQSAKAEIADLQHFLYEPNVALLKAGAFQSIAERFQLFKLATNTHLYTSNIKMDDFPGKTFEVVGKFKFKDPAIFDLLVDKKANIITRNFPYSVDEIKKTMKIKDGGNDFVFCFKDRAEKLCMVLVRRCL
jgi:16S rRNA G966 N2-methylase RsmD